MNLLHISDADLSGGAAQATYQLHNLLRQAGHRSILAVRLKTSSDPDVVPIAARSLRACSWTELKERAQSRLLGSGQVTSIPLHAFNKNHTPAPNLEAAFKAMPKPDVVILHWITNLMTVADIRQLAERVACPLLWVLMDMEPMTGGCHYPGNCTRFQVECKNCPQLKKDGRRDWAARTWHLKQQALSSLPITFVAATKWIGSRLAESALFGKHRIANIPLPINERMRPFSKDIARQILGVPRDRKIILTGSHNLREPRKGINYLISALRILEAQEMRGTQNTFRNEDVLVLLMGAKGQSLSAEIPFKCKDMGYVRSEIELALAYQAADVFASPSVEDAGPMMASQAMLCGTPVVAFNTGIAPELIISGINGYLARLGDADDFATGLQQMLSDTGSAGDRAAETAAQYHDPKHLIHSYNLLLNELTQRKGTI